MFTKCHCRFLRSRRVSAQAAISRADSGASPMSSRSILRAAGVRRGSAMAAMISCPGALHAVPAPGASRASASAAAPASVTVLRERPNGSGLEPGSQRALVLGRSADPLGLLGGPLLLEPINAAPDDLALQARQVVDEQRALQVVDLVLDRDGEEALALELERLAGVVEGAHPDLGRALDLLGLAGDGG